MYLKISLILFCFLFVKSIMLFSQSPYPFSNLESGKYITEVNQNNLNNNSQKIEISLQNITDIVVSKIILLKKVSVYNTSQIECQRETTGIAGSFEKLKLGKKTCYVQQIVGQASVSGSFKSNNYYLHQGFILPQYNFTEKKNKNIISQQYLDVSVYPNPFDSYVHITINEKFKNNVKLVLYDVKGNIILSNYLNQSNKSIYNLDYLPTGIYYINIHSANKIFSSKLIKVNR